jgi:hypothetical protein
MQLDKMNNGDVLALSSRGKAADSVGAWDELRWGQRFD